MSRVTLGTLPLFTVVLLGVAATVAGESPADQPPSPPGVYKRVVLLAFKPGTSPDRIEELLAGIRALGPKIPAIATLDVGPSTGDEKLSQGFTHVVLVTFRSQEDRKAFLDNATHKKYEKEVLDPHLERALVIEFTSPDQRRL